MIYLLCDRLITSVNFLLGLIALPLYGFLSQKIAPYWPRRFQTHLDHSASSTPSPVGIYWPIAFLDSFPVCSKSLNVGHSQTEPEPTRPSSNSRSLYHTTCLTWTMLLTNLLHIFHISYTDKHYHNLLPR